MWIFAQSIISLLLIWLMATGVWRSKGDRGMAKVISCLGSGSAQRGHGKGAATAGPSRYPACAHPGLARFVAQGLCSQVGGQVRQWLHHPGMLIVLILRWDFSKSDASFCSGSGRPQVL